MPENFTADNLYMLYKDIIIKHGLKDFHERKLDNEGAAAVA